jgi:hypothetical protein
MRDSSPRPVGVAVLGCFHLVFGSIGVVAVIADFALAVARGRQDSGIPAELLGAIICFAFVGPVVGTALLKGRPWAWYVATFLYVVAAIAGVLFVPALLGGIAVFAPLAHLARALTVTKIAVSVLVALYLFSGGVADFFGLDRRKRWAPLAAQIVVGAAVLFGLYAVLGERAIEPADDAYPVIQGMGERRANSDEDVAFMLDHLENGGMEERVAAAWALGRSGRGDVMEPLLEASREGNLNVRINAIGGVAELGGEEVLEELVSLLESGEPEVRAAALRGLAHEKFAGAASQVGELMLDDESVRAAAVDVLGNMGSGNALPFLGRVADDPDEDVRSRVAYALSKIGDRAALPILTGMLDDRRWTVRANAVQSLGKLGDAGARSAIEAMRDDPNSQVRAAAEAALARLP